MNAKNMGHHVILTVALVYAVIDGVLVANEAAVLGIFLYFL